MHKYLNHICFRQGQSNFRFPGDHHVSMKVCSFTLIIYIEQTNKQIKRTYETRERDWEKREALAEGDIKY